MDLDWDDQTFEPDLLVEHMRRLGLPLTRASYLEYSHPDGVPTPLPAEIAASVPRWLRDDEALH